MSFKKVLKRIIQMGFCIIFPETFMGLSVTNAFFSTWS